MLLRFAAVLEGGERGWKRLERGHRRADLNAGADVENRLTLLPETYRPSATRSSVSIEHTPQGQLPRRFWSGSAGSPLFGAGKRGAVSIAARSRRRSDVKFCAVLACSVKTIAARSSGPSALTIVVAMVLVLITPHSAPFVLRLPSSIAMTTTRLPTRSFVVTSGGASVIHTAGGGAGGEMSTAAKEATGRGFPSSRTVKSDCVSPRTGWPSLASTETSTWMRSIPPRKLAWGVPGLCVPGLDGVWASRAMRAKQAVRDIARRRIPPQRVDPEGECGLAEDAVPLRSPIRSAEHAYERLSGAGGWVSE